MPAHTAPSSPAYLFGEKQLSCWAFQFSWYFGQHFPSFLSSPDRTCLAWLLFDPVCGFRVEACGCSLELFCSSRRFNSSRFTTRFEEFLFFLSTQQDPVKNFGWDWRICFLQIWPLHREPWNVLVCCWSLSISWSDPRSKVPWLSATLGFISLQQSRMKLFWPWILEFLWNLWFLSEDYWQLSWDLSSFIQIF